jgi:probable HAF family extracellular repeat protein
VEELRTEIFRREELAMTAPLRLSIFSLLFAAASSLCSAQTSYTITDLGTLSSKGFSVARAVNATAEVTGSTGATNSNSSDVFLYSNGTMTSIGTLGGASGIGNGINATGQIAGYSQNSTGMYRAFMASNGKMTTSATWAAVPPSPMPSMMLARWSARPSLRTAKIILSFTAAVR